MKRGRGEGRRGWIGIGVWGLLAGAGLCAPASAQIADAAPPVRAEAQNQTPWIDTVLGAVEAAEGRRLRLAPMDALALAEAEAESQRPGRPMRFAVPTPTELTPRRHGERSDLGDGRVEWVLDIEAPGARSLNLGTDFAPIPGVVLYLLDAGGDVIGEAYDASDSVDGQLWTRLVPGDFAQVVAEMPEGAWEAFAGSFRVHSVNSAFLDVLTPGAPDDPFALAWEPLDGQAEAAVPLDGAARFGLRSAACHVDVACPEGAPYASQISSVARMTIGGTGLCSGVLMNNVREDQTPYFLTAHHCGAWNQPASIVFYWNYQHSICRPPGSTQSGAGGNGSLAQNQSGSVLRLTNPFGDITLLELNQQPDPAWNVDYAGWNANNNAGAPGAFAVHHPGGQEKRISLDDQGLLQTFVSLTGQPSIRVWRAQFDAGGIEGGSSGGPLYGGDGRVIGVGTAVDTLTACFPQLSFFGRVNYAWANPAQTGGVLSDWLDPDGTGALTLDPLFADLNGPNPFTLISPATNATAVPTESALTWEPALGAIQYRVIVDNEPSLSGATLVNETVSGTTFDLPAGLLAEKQTYYWGVVALGAFAETPSTPVFRAFTTWADCDDSGVDDAFEIAQGIALDCNLNGVPDACDVLPPDYEVTSPSLSPIGFNAPQDYTFSSLPNAGGEVTITFTTVGDINNSLERFEIFLNAVSIGEVYEEITGYFDCTQPGVDTLTVSAATWNSAISFASREVVISIVPSSAVNPSACLPGKETSVIIALRYPDASGGSAEDLNGNGIPDECENACGPADITADGACNPGSGEGAVSLSDFSCYLNLWANLDPAADITLDGACDPGAGGGDGVNLSDFSCFLNEWAQGCP